MYLRKKIPSFLFNAVIFFFSGQINQSQSLFTYAQNESVDTFAKPDFLPMFIENITWFNETVRQAALTQCGDDIECLFDAAATNDVSVGLVTKDINIQFENETNILGKSLVELCCTIYALDRNVPLHRVWLWRVSNVTFRLLKSFKIFLN